MKPHDHLGVTELAAHLNVTRQRLHQIRATYSDFPTPVAVLARSEVWHTVDVDAWVSKHPNRTVATRIAPK